MRILSIAVFLLVFEVDTAAAQREKPFRRGENVELKVHARWVLAEVRQVRPPLYLVATRDSFGDKEFFWRWVDGPRLRRPGSEKEGAGTFDQFEHRVSNDTVSESFKKAKTKYAAEQKAARLDGGASRSGRRAPGPTEPKPAHHDPLSAPPIEGPVVDADRKDLQTLTLDTELGWANAATDPAADVPDRRLAVRLRGSKWPGRPRVWLRGDTAVVRSTVTAGGARSKRPFMAVRVDLSRRRVTGEATFDIATRPEAMGPDGTVVAGWSNGFHLGTRHRVDVWDWATGPPKLRLSFAPAAGATKSKSDVVGLELPVDERLLTVTSDGWLTAWALRGRTVRGLWEVPGVRVYRKQAVWALSPGGRHVAVVTEGGYVLLLDAETGETAAALPDPAPTAQGVVFSSDGRWVLAWGEDQYAAWDLNDRVSVAGVGVAPVAENPEPPMVTPGGAVLWGERAFDALTGTTLAQVIWPGAEQAGPAGGLLATVEDGTPARLWLWPATGRDAPPAATADAQPMRILGAGTAVAIDVENLAATDDERAAVHASWSRLLTERGAVIDDDAAVRLVAVTLRTPITRIYDNPHHSDFEPRKQELTVDALRTRVVVSVDGYGAWQVETYSEPPRLLQRDRGQSVEEAVRASVPEDGPLKFVRKLDLPQSVAVPGGAGTPTLELRTSGG